MEDETADCEMDLSATPKDLKSMRSNDSALDHRAFVIQNRAAIEAAEQLKAQLSEEALTRLSRSRVLVTGASGYLGAALAALTRKLGCEVKGLDVAGPCEKTAALLGDVKMTTGSASESSAVAAAVGDSGAELVFHTAAWHAPHATHRTEAEFKETNVASVGPVLTTPGVRTVIVTGTTSHTITEAVKQRERSGECVWLAEDAGREAGDPPRNKYGRSKRAAEQLFLAAAGKAATPNVVVLRAPRFFCEDLLEGSASSLPNAMANELLGRRVALADLLTAHLLAAVRAAELNGRILTLCAPWPEALGRLGSAAAIGAAIVATFGNNAYQDAPGWRLPKAVTRVYDSSSAVAALGWRPIYTFEAILERLKGGDPVGLMGLY